MFDKPGDFQAAVTASVPLAGGTPRQVPMDGDHVVTITTWIVATVAAHRAALLTSMAQVLCPGVVPPVSQGKPVLP